MPTITISRKIIKNDDLIILPRKEFERMLKLRVETTPLSSRQKKAIKDGLREIEHGQYFSSARLKHELGL